MVSHNIRLIIENLPSLLIGCHRENGVYQILFGVVLRCFLVFALLFQGCTPTGSPVKVVGTAKFVPQSAPSAPVETGISQDPESGGIFLQWYGASGIAGFKVFRSDSVTELGVPVDFSLISTVSANSGLGDTSMTDNSVTTGVEYWYYLRQYANDGTVGSPSDTIHYQLLHRPALSNPKANSVVTSGNVRFVWNDQANGGTTVIRVLDIGTVPPVYVWISKDTTFFGGTVTSANYDFDSSATSPLTSGHSYQWRVDRFIFDSLGAVVSGSKSAWSSFSIQ